MTNDEIINTHRENSDYLNTNAMKAPEDTWEGAWGEINDMLNQARAEGYEEGAYNDFMELIQEYDLPDDKLTEDAKKLRDSLKGFRDRLRAEGYKEGKEAGKEEFMEWRKNIEKQAQSDLFKELDALWDFHETGTEDSEIFIYLSDWKALKKSKGIE